MSIANRDYRNETEDRQIARLDVRPVPPVFSDRPSPRACEFATGPVTPAMGKWAETISATYYSKRATRVRAILRGVGQ